MSMTDPTILQLLEKADCRYTLVVETSKRARQLIDGKEALHEIRRRLDLIRRDPPAKAEKHQPLRRCRRSRCGSKSTKAKRRKRGQSNERGAGLEKVTAGFHRTTSCEILGC